MEQGYGVGIWSRICSRDMEGELKGELKDWEGKFLIVCIENRTYRALHR